MLGKTVTKKRILFKNTHGNTLSNAPNDKYNFLKILNFRSAIILQVLFHFRGRRRLFPFNNVLFKQEISNDIILLCVDYGIAPRLEKMKAERNK